MIENLMKKYKCKFIILAFLTLILLILLRLTLLFNSNCKGLNFEDTNKIIMNMSKLICDSYSNRILT